MKTRTLLNKSKWLVLQETVTLYAIMSTNGVDKELQDRFEFLRKRINVVFEQINFLHGLRKH